MLIWKRLLPGLSVLLPMAAGHHTSDFSACWLVHALRMVWKATTMVCSLEQLDIAHQQHKRTYSDIPGLCMEPVSYIPRTMKEYLSWRGFTYYYYYYVFHLFAFRIPFVSHFYHHLTCII